MGITPLGADEVLQIPAPLLEVLADPNHRRLKSHLPVYFRLLAGIYRRRTNGPLGRLYSRGLLASSTTRSELAWAAGTNKRSVNRSLHALEAAQWLVRVYAHGRCASVALVGVRGSGQDGDFNKEVRLFSVRPDMRSALLCSSWYPKLAVPTWFPASPVPTQGA